jgi:hypothetical protein
MIPVTAELQEATVLSTAETLIGEIQTTDFKTLTLWADYVKGSEISMTIVPKALRIRGGVEYPIMGWQNVRTLIPTEKTFLLQDAGNYYVSIDIGGIELIKIYAYASSNVDPTGTLAMSYTMTGY